jgi:hypothetical protein
MINRQNPSERAQLKEGSDALDGARVATPAISDFYNNIGTFETWRRLRITSAH